MAVPAENKRRQTANAVAKEVFNETDTAQTTEQKERSEVLEAFAQSLIKKRDAAVAHRVSCGIETEWVENENLFYGREPNSSPSSQAAANSSVLYSGGFLPPPTGNKNQQPRSKAMFNITRPKCLTAEGRFASVVLPTDDKNWGIRPTPIPELSEALGDERPARYKGSKEKVVTNGKQLTVAQIAKGESDRAKRKAKAMERLINDQLTECGFNAEERKIIRNSVRLGTGVIKGPIVSDKVKKSWSMERAGDGKVIAILKKDTGLQPRSKSMSPWCVYPAPDAGEVVNKTASYVWDRETLTPRDLKKLAKVDGYFVDEIKAVLKEDPQKITVGREGEHEYRVVGVSGDDISVYERWSYRGDVDSDDLKALGVDVPDDEFPLVSADVEMVNDRPIRVRLNLLESGDLNYDFFQWTVRDGSPWGIGVPQEVKWEARIIIAALRAMMDNAGDSAGANIVIGDGIEPVDGSWVIRGKKIWKAIKEDMDVKKAFAQFQIEMNQAQFQQIIELALRFADMESMMPMMFSGEKGELPKTLGQTNIIVDSNNIAFRARVKLWDDSITVPHITRYYDFNMQYSDDDSVKGDSEVDARGVSVLLEADREAQDIKEIMAMRSDPELKILVDWEKAVQKFFEARKLDVMASEEEIAENRRKLAQAKPQADPGLQVAQIRTQGELQKAKLNQDSDMAELKFKAEEAEKQRQHERDIKAAELKIKMMEFSQTSGMELSKIKADLAKEASKQNLMRELSDKKGTPQMTKPPVEPPQKAPAGEAYQQ